jgi:hypothetical protein
MKFALTRVRFILMPDGGVKDPATAARAIQKMYDLEYGDRAGDVATKHWYQLTPNEERLSIALQTRFSNFAADENPLAVDCGENTYVFIRGNPLDGFFIPCDDCYPV